MTVSVADLQIPAKAWEHFDRAQRAVDAGRVDVFERESELALQVAPGFAEIYVLRAAHQVNTGQNEAAIATIATARSVQARAPWSGIVMAGALTQLHRYDDALAELDGTTGPEADGWQWKFEKTRAEIGRRDVEGALRWSAALLLAAPPDCGNAHLLRMNALQMAGRTPEAATEMERYLALGGQPPAIRAQVTQLLARTRVTLQEADAPLMAAR